jgi:cytochrome c oxidase assembly protein subunit 15
MNLDGFERSLIGASLLVLSIGAYFWMGSDRARYLRLIVATACLTLLLVVLGAYVRLSDAGLGCPDWPGCYGNLTPAHSAAEISAEESMRPGGPVTMAKAWKEMIHRYLAMIVGALIAAIMLSAWRNRSNWQQSPSLSMALAAAVIFQAALGAWTVTMLLKPAIVTSHLLGGISIFALLIWLAQRQPNAANWARRIMVTEKSRWLGWAALSVLAVQIALGGWVSTNYAALACSDLPTCHGAWFPAMDFSNAFHVLRPLGYAPSGELLTHEALRAIHWVHRVGAMITMLVLGSFGGALLKSATGNFVGRGLLALLGMQILLGLSNVWFGLPLAVAVAHNGVAAMLFALLLSINLRIVNNNH